MPVSARLGCLVAVVLLAPLAGQAAGSVERMSSMVTIRLSTPWYTELFGDSAVIMRGAKGREAWADQRPWGQALPRQANGQMQAATATGRDYWGIWRELRREQNGHYAITLYRITPEQELKADFDYPISFELRTSIGTFRSPGSWAVRMPEGVAADTVDIEIQDWIGLPRRMTQLGALALSLALAGVVSGVYGVRRYRRSCALTALSDMSVASDDHRVRSAALAATVAELAVETQELERWSRAFQR